MNFLTRKYYNVLGEGRYSDSKDIKELLRLESEQSELGLSILKFIDLIKHDSPCNIKGSKELIELYNSIDEDKWDLTIPLSEVEYIGFFHDNEIILNLDGYNARGTYAFTGTFLDSLFNMKKFGNFCLTHGEKDLLNENLKKLMISQKDEVRQYRFLKDGDNVLLRGLTTKYYKNYDNNIAIYLALHSLHLYSEKNKVHISVESGYVSDSDLDISFIQEEKINIDKDTFVEIGVRLTNNEITEGKLSMEFIYTVSDKKNNKFRAIGDTVVGIIHNFQVQTIQNKLEELNELSHYTEETIKHISSIKNKNKLDRDQLSLIFRRLSRAKVNQLNNKTKQVIDNLYTEEVIGNTYSLIELFNKIESVETTIDERLFIQIVFNELISKSL